MKYISDNGNYALCRECETVIETKQVFRKSRKSPTGRTYHIQPYCPTCDKIRNYRTMKHYTRRQLEQMGKLEPLEGGDKTK